MFWVSQRGMLAQLAARLRARQGGAEGEGGGGVRLGNDGEAIVVDDDCLVCAAYCLDRRLGIRKLTVAS